MTVTNVCILSLRSSKIEKPSVTLKMDLPDCIRYWNLGIALRYILEALRKKHGSNMYYFGITALDRFKTK